MGWADVLRALGRRWYIIVAGILITGGLVFAAWRLVPPTYSAEGTILLLPSKSTVSQGGQNPFLNLDSLSAPAALVIARLDGEAERSKVARTAPTAEYSVDTDPTMRGPTVLITVTDKTAASTLATLNSMLDTSDAILSDIQTEQKVPSDAIIGSMRLTVDTKATRVTSDTVRTVVATAVVSLIVTLALAVGIDAWVRHSRERRRTNPSRRQLKRAERAEDAKKKRSAKPARIGAFMSLADSPSDELPKPDDDDLIPDLLRSKR